MVSQFMVVNQRRANNRTAESSGYDFNIIASDSRMETSQISHTAQCCPTSSNDRPQQLARMLASTGIDAGTPRYLLASSNTLVHAPVGWTHSEDHKHSLTHVELR
jgi:hypothetical protein